MTTTNETILNTITSFSADFLTHKMGSDYCEGKLVGALKQDPHPTWDTYSARHKAFMEQKPVEVSEATAQKQWNRLNKQAGVTIPKSTDPEAVAKQNQREEKAKRFAEIPDQELETKIKNLKAIDPTVAKPYEREQARRVKEANKPQEEAIKATRARVREALKDCVDMKRLENALIALLG